MYCLSFYIYHIILIDCFHMENSLKTQCDINISRICKTKALCHKDSMAFWYTHLVNYRMTTRFPEKLDNLCVGSACKDSVPATYQQYLAVYLFVTTTTKKLVTKRSVQCHRFCVSMVSLRQVSISSVYESKVRVSSVYAQMLVYSNTAHCAVGCLFID